MGRRYPGKGAEVTCGALVAAAGRPSGVGSSTPRTVCSNCRVRLQSDVAGLFRSNVSRGCKNVENGSKVILTLKFMSHARGFGAAAACYAVLCGMRVYCTAKAEVLVVARVQRLLFTSLLTQDIATFDREGTGKLVSRLTSDVRLIGRVLSTNVNVILQQGLLLTGSLAALFRLSPQPALGA